MTFAQLVTLMATRSEVNAVKIEIVVAPDGKASMQIRGELTEDEAPVEGQPLTERQAEYEALVRVACAQYMAELGGRLSEAGEVSASTVVC